VSTRVATRADWTLNASTLTWVRPLQPLPSQTVLDLAHRPDLGGVPNEAGDAIRALWARVDSARLADLADRMRLKAALARARKWATD